MNKWMKPRNGFERFGAAAALMVGTLLLAAGSARAQATRTWDGGGGDNLASTAANWSDNTRPSSTDDILLDDTSVKDMIWDAGINDLPDTVASWTQTGDYTGTVTFPILYGSSGFTNFTINGNVMIEGGRWTHTINPAGDTPTYRLAVTVNGAFTLGDQATIDVDSHGFQAGAGPGKGTSDHRGPSHGGQGGYKTASTPAAVYGCPFQPVTLGSGGASGGGGGPGGGAIQLTVRGHAHLDGMLLARGGFRPANNNYRPGSGGSIAVTAGTIDGDGELDARGSAGALGNTWPGGGGGRIALVVTNGMSFGSVTCKASGQTSSVIGSYGAAGTIYHQTMDQALGEGTLTIDNNNYSLSLYAVTLPAGTLDLNALNALVVTNGGMFAVTDDTILDFSQATIRGGAELKIRSTNQVVFPPAFAITDAFRLGLDTPVTATGDWTIHSGGILTHSLNFYGGSNPAHYIDVTLDGDLEIQDGGVIDVSERGFPLGEGPGAGTGDSRGASHGGHGGSTLAFNDVTPTYGSVLFPVTHGSGGSTGGGNRSGGGQVRLEITGEMRVDGKILAKGGDRSAAGGSIAIRSGTVVGDGELDASGGDASNWCGGGGGRIAVVLNTGTSIGSVVRKAFGGDGGGTTKEGSAGTVYIQLASDKDGAGSVYVANNNLNPSTFTPLPPYTGSTEDLSETSWFVTNKGRLGLGDDATLAGLDLGAEGYLELDGHTLTVQTLVINGTPYPNNTYTAADLGSQVTDASGDSSGRVIVYRPPPGSLFLMR